MTTETEIEISEEYINLVAESAALAGLLLLENGGETFRAEETAIEICRAGGCETFDVLALPTGIFITLSMPHGKPVSTVTRVKKRTTNLMKLERVNSFARSFCQGSITIDELKQNLQDLANIKKKTNRFLGAAIAGTAAAMFTHLFGGTLFDFAVSFVCGVLIRFFSTSFGRTNIYHFTVSFIGGIIIASVAVLATSLCGMGSIDKISVGAMQALLPGLAMTNAIRDTVMGDLVSGTARAAEALLVAVAIAAGVGSVLSLYISLGGVI